jgi:hypothetical protein
MKPHEALIFFGYFLVSRQESDRGAGGRAPIAKQSKTKQNKAKQCSINNKTFK